MQIIEVPWPFDDDPSTAAFVSKAVLEGREEPLYVTHNHECEWEVVGDSGAETSDDVALLCIEDVVRRWPMIGSLAKLPPGWTATFDPAVPEWVVAPADFV